MSKLYIKVDENNMYIDHPHFESNVRNLYPNHDFESGPPPGWMEFVRVEPPTIGVYDTFDETIGGNIALAFEHNGLEYAIVDGKYTDVWHHRAMTDEEKLAKQNAVKERFAETLNYASWTFDEEKCQMVAPVDYPTDAEKPCTWDEENQTWVPIA